MTARAISVSAVLLAAAAGAAETNGLERAERRIFSGSVLAEISSAYLASSGSLCDTRPIFSQELDYQFDFGEWGWIDGYGWIVSSLHNGQRELHRWLLNEFEMAIHYGYRLETSKHTALKTQFGYLWNPQIGYYDDSNRYMGPHLAQSFENPWLEPYYNALWLMAPRMRTRIRIGVRRTFALPGDLSIRPSVETVWSDGRRYYSKYGTEPEWRILGGGFATARSDLKLTWRMTEDLSFYAQFQYLVVLGHRARSAERARSVYWSKTEFPIGIVGFEYAF